MKKVTGRIVASVGKDGSEFWDFLMISGNGRIGGIQNQFAVRVNQPDLCIQIDADSAKMRLDGGQIFPVILLFKIISYILVGHVDPLLVKSRCFFYDNLFHDQIGGHSGDQEKAADAEQQVGKNVFLGQCQVHYFTSNL